MPRIDVVDSTWLPARPAIVGPIVGDDANWARWWPGLGLVASQRRGREGVRWIVTGVEGMTGTAEVWLEPQADGVVAHFFLRLDPVGSLTERAARRLATSWRRRTKLAFWALADDLDPDRVSRLTAP